MSRTKLQAASLARAALARAVVEALEPRRLLTGTVVFEDSFDVSTYSSDVNFEAADRQGGPLAPTAYSTHGSPGFRQVGNPVAAGRLVVAGTTRGNGLPNSRVGSGDLWADPGPGGTLAVEVDVNPVWTGHPGQNYTQTAWAAVKVGSAAADRGVFDPDGFGVVVNGEGFGGFAAFDGAANVATGAYTVDRADVYHHLRLELSSLDPAGRPLDGTPARVRGRKRGHSTFPPPLLVWFPAFGAGCPALGATGWRTRQPVSWSFGASSGTG